MSTRDARRTEPTVTSRSAPAPSAPGDRDPRAVVEVLDLTKRYDDLVAVDDLSLTVRPGEVLGVLGRNGAGKTTTVEVIAGLRRPDGGRVRVLGLDPARDRRRIRQVLGVQLQRAALHGLLTVDELLRLHRSFHAEGADVDQLLDDLELTDHRDQRFDDLSGGQQQRVSIAVALVGRPRVVVLDELTTGLDPTTRRSVWGLVEALRDDGVTVLLVSHAMEEVQRLCDRVALLEAGRLVALDTPAGLIRRSGGEQRVRFTALAAFEPSVLTDRDDVHAVEVTGDEVLVTGRGELLRTVSEALADHGVAATGTRLEAATLDDAFLALTGGRDGAPASSGRHALAAADPDPTDLEVPGPDAADRDAAVTSAGDLARDHQEDHR